MSTDEAWKKVQSQLSQLLGDKAFSHFHSFLEKLQQLSSAKPYPPEIFAGFVEIVQKMNVEVNAGRSVPDILRQASTGGYIQPEWDVHSVYQANGHVFQFVFGKFLDEMGASHSKPIEVPIILLVMDAVEAEELASLSAFQNYPAKLRNDFKRLKKRLNKEIPDWQNRYQNTPELWQPFVKSHDEISIKLLVIQALDIAKDMNGEIKGKVVSFHPLFQDIRSINDDRAFLKRLRRDGCVIIMDIISMCHPVILRSFQKSLLDAYSDTFVMTFAPTYSILEEVHKVTATFHVCLSELEFVKRRSDHDEDYGACQEIWKESDFQHWLKDRSGKTIDQRVAPRSKRDRGILHHINRFDESDGGRT